MPVVYNEVIGQSVISERALAHLQALREEVDHRFPEDQQVLLLLDNARYHRPEDLMATFGTRTPRHRFLAPYSPFLNAIEDAFNTLKAAAKHQLRMRRGDILAIQQLQVRPAATDSGRSASSVHSGNLHCEMHRVLWACGLVLSCLPRDAGHSMNFGLIERKIGVNEGKRR